MNASTVIKSLNDILQEPITVSSDWSLKVVIHDDNLTYLASNTFTKEAIWVDPAENDWEVLITETSRLKGYRFLAVIDTHTHADHLSCASALAKKIGCPLIMHQSAPTREVDLRVCHDTVLSSAAGPLQLWITPGHTADGITPAWGPFLFTGDTLLYGDTGRDDLPTGNPQEHFASIQKIKNFANKEHIVLPGHDSMGGRASSWAKQLEICVALSQTEAEYLSDGGAWVGKPPKLLKESLLHNFK